MSFIIDRFEGDLAVVEIDGKEMRDIPKDDISPAAKEGDVIILVNGRYEIDTTETKRIKDEAEKLMNDLF